MTTWAPLACPLAVEHSGVAGGVGGAAPPLLDMWAIAEWASAAFPCIGGCCDGDVLRAENSVAAKMPTVVSAICYRIGHSNFLLCEQ